MSTRFSNSNSRTPRVGDRSNNSLSPPSGLHLGRCINFVGGKRDELEYDPYSGKSAGDRNNVCHLQLGRLFIGGVLGYKRTREEPEKEGEGLEPEQPPKNIPKKRNMGGPSEATMDIILDRNGLNFEGMYTLHTLDLSYLDMGNFTEKWVPYYDPDSVFTLTYENIDLSNNDITKISWVTIQKITSEKIQVINLSHNPYLEHIFDIRSPGEQAAFTQVMGHVNKLILTEGTVTGTVHRSKIAPWVLSVIKYEETLEEDSLMEDEDGP